MNLTSFGIDNAVKEYCSGIVDVIEPNCTEGVYISSCEPLINDCMKFLVVEITFYYAWNNRYDKSYELLMYQQDFNRIDVVRMFDDYSKCLTAFNAVKYINH